jgi:isopenicillin N synthase-like dioxygenase
MARYFEIPKDVLQRFETDGFIVLNVDNEIQQSIQTSFDAGSLFFSGTLHEKRASILPADTGYRPFGVEYSDNSKRPDQMESFSVSLKTRNAAHTLESDRARSLHKAMLRTMDLFETIAEVITIRVANELGGREQSRSLCGAFHRWSFLQLNYSRPSQVKDGFINDTHEDGCLMTVASANGPGFELETAHGSYRPANSKPNEVLILPGEIIWLLSGGRIRPLFHRVYPDRALSERMSLLFFGDIDPRLCTPWIKNNINEGIDIGHRVLKNPSRFGLQEWNSDKEG